MYISSNNNNDNNAEYRNLVTHCITDYWFFSCITVNFPSFGNRQYYYWFAVFFSCCDVSGERHLPPCPSQLCAAVAAYLKDGELEGRWAVTMMAEGGKRGSVLLLPLLLLALLRPYAAGHALTQVPVDTRAHSHSVGPFFIISYREDGP